MGIHGVGYEEQNDYTRATRINMDKSFKQKSNIECKLAEGRIQYDMCNKVKHSEQHCVLLTDAYLCSTDMKTCKGVIQAEFSIVETEAGPWQEAVALPKESH